jgi:DNA-binding helix-turn-helix protein
MKLRCIVWENLKKVKEEKGLTYRGLSELTGISQTTLTTLFSANLNYKVGRIIEISKELDVDLSYVFGEVKDQILSYPENEEEAIQNFWRNIDNFYLNHNGDKHYSRKKIYRLMGKTFYKAVGEDKILLSLDVLEQFSTYLNTSPLRLVSKRGNVDRRLYFKKQNSLAFLHLQERKSDVATYIVDGDYARYKVENWLMGMIAGTGRQVVVLTDINDKQKKIFLEWGESLVLRLQENGQELYSCKSEKGEANELLTKISRKREGYESYLNLLRAKENGVNFICQKKKVR